MTSKLQVTVPRAIADAYFIRPGDEIEWVAAGEIIQVVPPGRRKPSLDRKARVALFDQATARQRRRQSAKSVKSKKAPAPTERGWSRDELYDRGRTR